MWYSMLSFLLKKFTPGQHREQDLVGHLKVMNFPQRSQKILAHHRKDFLESLYGYAHSKDMLLLPPAPINLIETRAILSLQPPNVEQCHHAPQHSRPAPYVTQPHLPAPGSAPFRSDLNAREGENFSALLCPVPPVPTVPASPHSILPTPPLIGSQKASFHWFHKNKSNHSQISGQQCHN